MKIFHKRNLNHWILEYGFNEEYQTVIGIPCQYETCLAYSTYNLWVGIDFHKRLVHIYQEYECGGEISRRTFNFSHVDMDNEYDFITELDTIVNEYMEEE